jgi:predicted nucleotidyltransferase
MEIKQIVDKILKLDSKHKVKFIILFGSVSKKTNNPLSDVDVAVFYDGNDKQRFNFQTLVSGSLPDKVDFHIFQDLPLTLKNEILSGKLLYYSDYQFVFDEFMKVIKEFDLFEKYYRESLQEVVKRAEA